MQTESDTHTERYTYRDRHIHTLRTRYTHNDSDTLSETHTERKRITHLETYILRDTHTDTQRQSH